MKNQRSKRTHSRSKRAILADYMMTLIELARLKESIRASSKLARAGVS